jgi:holo-[acyl-carrier protein] synthase
VVSVGIDLVSVSEVRESLTTFGDRYVKKLFTARELEDCQSSTDPVPRLAARFAAKEAAIKALKVDGAQPAWTSMEVMRSPGGWCDEIRLNGRALKLAEQRGVCRLLVSLSHEEDSAVAIVVATRSLHGVRV